MILGKPASQLNDPWYKRPGNATDIDVIESQCKQNVRAVSYLKVEHLSRGCTKKELQYWKTLPSGYMIYVDVANVRIGVVQGFKSNAFVEASTRREFNKAFKRVLSILSL